MKRCVLNIKRKKMKIKTDKDIVLTAQLKDAVKTIGPITITEQFIEYRELQKAKFRNNGRNDYDKTMHADCLLLEYTLLTNGLANKNDNLKEYDFSLDADFKNLIDAKCIASKYFNIKPEGWPGGLDWFNQNFHKKLLTHFAFFKFITHDKPFVIGDIVSIQILDVVNAFNVLSEVRPSRKSGYYYII